MVNALLKHMRHCLLFLYDKNNSISAREAADELARVYGDDAPKKSVCGEWLGRFKRGEKSVDDLEDVDRSGRPSLFNENALRRRVEADPQVTLRELASNFQCSISTVHSHLIAIGMVSKLGKWVPHLLSERNKSERVRVANELLERYRRGELNLDEILTGDEKWVLHTNVVRRRSWVRQGETAPPTPKPGGLVCIKHLSRLNLFLFRPPP